VRGVFIMVCIRNCSRVAGILYQDGSVFRPAFG
jgi:hypothetical protein